MLNNSTCQRIFYSQSFWAVVCRLRSYPRSINLFTKNNRSTFGSITLSSIFSIFSFFRLFTKRWRFWTKLYTAYLQIDQTRVVATRLHAHSRCSIRSSNVQTYIYYKYAYNIHTHTKHIDILDAVSAHLTGCMHFSCKHKDVIFPLNPLVSISGRATRLDRLLSIPQSKLTNIWQALRIGTRYHVLGTQAHRIQSHMSISLNMPQAGKPFCYFLFFSFLL